MGCTYILHSLIWQIIATVEKVKYKKSVMVYHAPVLELKITGTLYISLTPAAHRYFFIPTNNPTSHKT